MVQPETFETHLRGSGISEEEVNKRLALAEAFGRFLKSMDGKDIHTAGKSEAEKFSGNLIAEGRNTLENFSALRDWAGWIGNRGLYVGWIELMDCHNALEVLAAEIARRHGGVARKKIFSGPLPPLGADEKERTAYTLEIAGRMARIIPADQARLAWFQVQHGIPADAWRQSDEADAALFHRLGEIDRFLDTKRAERDALLTRLHDRGELWYTVAITDAVLAYVKSDPEMEVGRRDGDKIFISKIPCHADRYLRETDPETKRYLACHCPLARQAILDGRPIPPEVCHCSLGHASHYLAGISRACRGEVLESVVRGDPRCRFVFHLESPESQTGTP
jgi:hypothetical protein